MRLCFDATRFGCGLDGAIELAGERGFSAVEYSFAPFPVSGKNAGKLDAKEKKHLQSMADKAAEGGVEIACLNLDYCFQAQDKKAIKQFGQMLAKVLNVAKTTGCKRVSFSCLPAGPDGEWRAQLTQELIQVQDSFGDDSVSLLLRLSTPASFRDHSLKHWQSMRLKIGAI